MPAPTPTSPTLNDLMYGAYNLSGYQNVSTLVQGLFISVSDLSITKENMVPNLADYTATVNTSDFLGAAGNVVVAIDTNDHNQFSINTSDTVTTGENSIATAPFNPANTDVVTVKDIATTFDVAAVVEA